MKGYLLVSLLVVTMLVLVSCSSNEPVKTNPLLHDAQACRSDVDCVPHPSSCHPTSCVNTYAAAILPKSTTCTTAFERNAVYKPEDCICLKNTCTNKKILTMEPAKTIYVDLSSPYEIFDTPKDCEAKSLICESGMIPYVDETGCGCKPSIVVIGDSIDPLPLNETTTILLEHNCSLANKEKETCVQVVSPVCGWLDTNILDCTNTVCKQVFSNACEACRQSDVVFWTDGECPPRVTNTS